MRRVRSFAAVVVALIVFAAALTSSLRAAPAKRGLSPFFVLQAAPDGGNYVGPGSCSAVACHGAIRPVAGAAILQTEYSTWVAMDRHARATDALGNSVSQRMARIL